MISYIFLLSCVLTTVYGACVNKSVSSFTTNGKQVTEVCAGQLIFEENFDNLDTDRWTHEITLTGFGNGEFEYYLDSRDISYAKDGNLHIEPKMLSSYKGDDFLYHGVLDLGKACTNSDDSGCYRQGQPGKILNPIMSARMHTTNSFKFRYGKLEARAKIPEGDWLWPAIWLLPYSWQYGNWPRSGEIDVMESKGNVDQRYPYSAYSTLHWGPDAAHNMYAMTHWEKENEAGYQNDFHLFQLEWTPDQIVFSIDNQPIGQVSPPAGGFWQYGNLDTSGEQNPWAGRDKMAPFDEEFYIIINLAIGGTKGYFPETNGKPWKNWIDRFIAMTEFWEGRSQWLDSWKLSTDKSHFQVDYVKVWAL